MAKISLFMSFLLNKAVGGLSIPPDAVTVTNSRSHLWEFNMEFNMKFDVLFLFCVQFVCLALAVFCSLVAIAATSDCKYLYTWLEEEANQRNVIAISSIPSSREADQRAVHLSTIN
jgi:hypothetical protein